jgi:hypothetical protein
MAREPAALAPRLPSARAGWQPAVIGKTDAIDFAGYLLLAHDLIAKTGCHFSGSCANCGSNASIRVGV